MAARRTEQRRLELIDKLEALHMLCVEADAFLSAFEAVYSNTSWPTEKHPEHRRALSRMSCYIEQLNVRIADLLRASHAAVELAMNR